MIYTGQLESTQKWVFSVDSSTLVYINLHNILMYIAIISKSILHSKRQIIRKHQIKILSLDLVSKIQLHTKFYTNLTENDLKND